MDDLHRHLFTVLMDREWTHGVTAAVDVALVGRFYEPSLTTSNRHEGDLWSGI